MARALPNNPAPVNSSRTFNTSIRFGLLSEPFRLAPTTLRTPLPALYLIDLRILRKTSVVSGNTHRGQANAVAGNVAGPLLTCYAGGKSDEENRPAENSRRCGIIRRCRHHVCWFWNIWLRAACGSAQ